MTTFGLSVALLIAGAATQAAPARPLDACGLLTADDVRTVQSAAVRERKPTTDRANALVFAQCVFATTDVTRSVSLTVISGTDHDAARNYWNKTFHPQRTEAQLKAATRKKDLPRAIDAAGEEAFWTGDKRAGALYVLSRDVVIRISVGGISEEEERIRRSAAFAKIALSRLTTPGV